MLQSALKGILHAANFLGSCIERGVDVAADLFFFRWLSEKKILSADEASAEQKTGKGSASAAKGPAGPETRYIIPPEILPSGK